MANPEHVQVAMGGQESLQKWREANPNVRLELSGAYLSSAPLQNADLSRSNLVEADLSAGHLRMAHLRASNLERAHLHRADMYQADIRGARAVGAYLLGAGMAEAQLSGTNLTGADLSQVDLGGADLSRANLTRATLFRASLQGANLSGTILTGADLSWADLSEANLSEAHFFEAKLAHTTLNGANFHRAFFLNTVLVDCDLSSSRNLEEIVHRGPSSLGIDTIFRSQGKLPDEFLRGIGVPETFITYQKGLPSSLVRRYGCYISYGPDERDIAIRLQADLRVRGIDCWRFPASPTGSGFLEEEIDRGVRFYDKLVVVCSQGSMGNESIRNEVNLAIQKQRETGRWVLFLIAADDAIYQRQDRSTRLLRQHLVQDFRGIQDPTTYVSALEVLAANLKGDKEAASGMATT